VALQAIQDSSDLRPPFHWLSRAAFVCCLLGLASVAQSEPATLVGILEDVAPGNLSPGMADVHVRVAFRKEKGEWVPFETGSNTLDKLKEGLNGYPESVVWTVVINGKSLGRIESKNPATITAYGDIGIQTITTARDNIPRIPVKDSDFQHFGNPPKARPLVLTSGTYYKDPDEWKPSNLTVAEREAANREFRRRIPNLEQCDKPEEKPIRMVPYSDGEIILLKSFRSKSGEVLYGLRLDDTRSNCGFFDDKNFFDYWFAMHADRQIRFLDSQMDPIDAADLDGSGHVVWIFQISRGEDEDGYELFYDGFVKKALFHFTYH